MSERTSAYDQYAPLLMELAACSPDDPRRDELVSVLVDA